MFTYANTSIWPYSVHHNEDSSTDSLEQEYRRVMARVEVMRSNRTGDAADAEVTTAFGSASAAPLVCPLGITRQMESEWDKEEDERPNLTLRVSAMDIRSSPAFTQPATTVRDMRNPKNVWQSAFSR